MRMMSSKFITKELANYIEDDKILEIVVNNEDVKRMRHQMKLPLVSYDKIVSIQDQTKRTYNSIS